MLEQNKTVHSECSPSQVQRILLCPGSRRLLRENPTGTSSFAKEGTMLHEIVEQRLKTWIENNSPIFTVLANKEHETLVQECFDYVLQVLYEITNEYIAFKSLEVKTEEKMKDILFRLMKTGVIEVLLESPTTLEWYGLPEVSGHSDVVLKCDLLKRRDVIDFKFGAGVPVTAPNNIQGMSYATGTFDSLTDLKAHPDIRIHIVQPRLDYFSCWETSANELSKWLEFELAPGIIESRNDKAKLIPGKKQCQFCLGAKCPARTAKVIEDAKDVFTNYIETNKLKMEVIPDEELKDLLEKTDMIKTFISELNTYAMNRCSTATGFPGYKVVAGRNSRKWKDPEKAQEYLVALAEDQSTPFDFSNVFETKFISVAKAEKLSKELKKSKEFKDLYSTLSGGPILVKEEDPRPSIIQNAQQAFAQFKEK